MQQLVFILGNRYRRVDWRHMTDTTIIAAAAAAGHSSGLMSTRTVKNRAGESSEQLKS
jgi:hypothetical protein